ncbi:MAG TPA: hypothetical protein VN224_11610 [Xanthomonadales bacterium]|nr:hypothetical protein [Xanthomonadales bacterium]
MKDFTMPRVGAAGFTSPFRARSIEQMLRRADTAASLQRSLDRDDAFRVRLRRADSIASFWILHAR